AGRWDIPRRDALGALQARLPPAGAGALPPVPPAIPGRPRRRPRGGPAGVLREDRGSAAPGGLRRSSRATAAEELVRLHQAALRRAGGGARLSRPLHPSRRHLEQSPRCSRRARRDLPLQGLSPQRAGAVPHNDAQGRRVHQALPASRSTKGVSSQADLDGATFDGVLEAGLLQVGGYLSMASKQPNMTVFKKDVNLNGAKITGRFDVDGASFEGKVN